MAAIDVLRVAKNAFLWLAVAAIALHLVAFAVVFSASDDAASIGSWSDRFDQPLTMAGFVARAGVFVVNGIFVISLLVCLSARMGGAAALARGTVSAMAALAMVLPWINANDTLNMTTALYGSADVYRVVGGDAALGAIGFIRFAVCPIIVILLMFLAQWNYRLAYRKMTLSPAARLPIHEV